MHLHGRPPSLAIRQSRNTTISAGAIRDGALPGPSQQPHTHLSTPTHSSGTPACPPHTPTQPTHAGNSSFHKHALCTSDVHRIASQRGESTARVSDVSDAPGYVAEGCAHHCPLEEVVAKTDASSPPGEARCFALCAPHWKILDRRPSTDAVVARGRVWAAHAR